MHAASRIYHVAIGHPAFAACGCVRHAPIGIVWMVCAIPRDESPQMPTVGAGPSRFSRRFPRPPPHMRITRHPSHRRVWIAQRLSSDVACRVAQLSYRIAHLSRRFVMNACRIAHLSRCDWASRLCRLRLRAVCPDGGRMGGLHDSAR